LVIIDTWVLPSGDATLTQPSLYLKSATIDQQWQLRTVFRSGAELTQWGGEGFRYPLQRLQFLQHLHLPDTEAYVLVNQQDQVIAFGQICNRFAKIHLARLLVLPDFRRQGLSQQLIAALISRGLTQWPKREASLFVFLDNTAAIKSYQRLGFKPATQPSAPRTDLYFMTLDHLQGEKLAATAAPFISGNSVCQFG
jgi:GNAT superfamily N-acetyltransferase